jgi:hypothetical protein
VTTPKRDSASVRAERLELYKLAVEMADRVSQRRQTANSFYLSLNALFVGGSAYLSDTQTLIGNLLVTAAGISISLLWWWNSLSYKTLNDAKFEVIQEIEKQLPLQPYTREWAKLDPDRDGIRHRPFHKVERVVPWIFIAVYVVQGVRKLPWTKIIAAIGGC